jgi:hypothetical protein
MKRDFILSFFKHIFGGAAHRADPIVGEFFKGGIWRDVTIGIAFFRIIDITADIAFPFFHLNLLSEFKFTPSPALPLGDCVLIGGMVKNVMLNSENVMLNLFQHLFRAG